MTQMIGVMRVNVLASAMEGLQLNVDLVNGSACSRPGLLSPGQDTKTCSTPNAQPYPNIHLVASKSTPKHASSFQSTLFTLSAVCILPILTAAAPPASREDLTSRRQPFLSQALSASIHYR
ncbi:hypothetical protein FALCPG4_008885 [Fusarium falciforme]